MRTPVAAGVENGEAPVSTRRSTTLPSWLAPAGLALVVAVGIVARFVQPSPLWLDEALSVNIAALPLGDIGDALLRDGHPPLYYWLLHAWMEVFGTSDLAVRSLSGVISVATLPLAWMAGRRIGGRKVAAWTLLIVAVSPFAIRYATEARMYSLVMALVLSGVILVHKSLEDPRPLPLVGLAVVTGGLCWSHYWALYLVAVTGICMVGLAFRSPPRRRAATRCALAIAVGTATFLPWVPSILDQLSSTATPWGEPSRPTTVLMTTFHDFGGRGELAESQILGMLGVALLLVALFGRLEPGERAVELTGRVRPVAAPLLGVAAATLALGSIAMLASDTAYATRYAAVVAPLVWIGTAVGATQVPLTWPRAAVAVALVGFSAVGMVDAVITDRTSAGDMASRIAEAAGPDDIVVACPDQLGVALQRELRQRGSNIPVVPYPAGGDPRFIDWRDYAERNADADPIAFADDAHERAGNGAVWLYTSSEYRTVEEACAEVSARLASHRPLTETHPAPDAFEFGSLLRFAGADG